MKQTQIIMNQSRLKGGKKPPTPREYDRADEILRPGELIGPPNLDACKDCYKVVSHLHCSDCGKIQHD